MERVRKFIDRTLDTRITPLAYLIAGAGIVRGIAYTFFQTAEGVSNTVLSQIGPIIPLTVWGVIVFASSLVLMYGLITKDAGSIMVGSMGMFLTWVLTAITYMLNGYLIFLFPTAVIYSLIYGYFFLSASLGRLWDYTPLREDKK